MLPMASGNGLDSELPERSRYARVGTFQNQASTVEVLIALEERSSLRSRVRFADDGDDDGDVVSPHRGKERTRRDGSMLTALLLDQICNPH